MHGLTITVARNDPNSYPVNEQTIGNLKTFRSWYLAGGMIYLVLSVQLETALILWEFNWNYY